MKRKIILGVLSAVGISALALAGYNRLTAERLPEEMPAHEDILPPLEANLCAGLNVNQLEGDTSYKRGFKYLLKESTYVNIKNQGFDHLRLPINFCLFYSEEEDALDEENMQKIDEILNLAERAGLYTFIDFHGWWELGKNYKTDAPKFIRIWQLVAERYKDRSNHIAFELLNEPKYNHLPPAKLNELQAETVAVIRETNPERLILLAAPDGNQPWLLGEMQIPEGDENLAVAVHIYHPGDFTHQGFTWAGREAGKQVRLDEKMKNELKWNLDETKKFTDNTGIPVFLNEFGLNLNLADKEDIDYYIRTITQFCKDNSIPWTWWEYNSGEMGLYVWNKWRTEILDALFLRK